MTWEASAEVSAAPTEPRAIRSPVATLAFRGALVGALSAYGVPMLFAEGLVVATIVTNDGVAAAAQWTLLYAGFGVVAAVVWGLLGAGAGAVAGSSFSGFSRRLPPKSARLATGAVEGVLVGIFTGAGIGVFYSLDVVSILVVGVASGLLAMGTAASALRTRDAAVDARELHDVAARVTAIWLTNWQVEEEPDDVHVGDHVEWTISASDDEWMDTVFDRAPTVAGQVDNYRDDDSDTSTLVGTVTALRAVMPLYAYAREGEPRSERFPVRGATVLTEVDSTARRVGLIRPNGVIGYVATVTRVRLAAAQSH
ncbi:hypothetical protein ASF54_04270 [Frondihabitans sp. Leaf304]|nr:hypothetical protein ASF54_04270 [Frondihabitans sp. Leaf304]